ncbi:MAG: hypothetical protein NTZ73_03135 [Candidatus Diapherotrites archaeon]|nr:hypothetical protein [Candidatus Diapherotrites archaeon]
MNKRLLLLLLIVLAAFPFAFANPISITDPIFLASGLILVIFAIDFCGDFVAAFFASKLLGEKRIFEEVSIKQMFSMLLAIAILGLIVDFIAMIIISSFSICNLMAPQQCLLPYENGLIGFIFSFGIAFVLLFVTDFCIIKTAKKISVKKAIKYSVILAILTNPVIAGTIFSTGFFIISAVVIVALFGWVFENQKKLASNDESRIFSKWGWIIFILLIAGVFLFFVSPIPSPPNVGSARDNIANTLNATKNGGSQTSQNFALVKGDALTGKDFSKWGFDQHSLVFATRGIPEGLIEVATAFGDEGFSQFTYKSPTKFNAKAAVYCEATGNVLKDVIEDNNLNAGGDIVGLDGISLCGIDENGGMYQPCCLVVIKRA